MNKNNDCIMSLEQNDVKPLDLYDLADTPVYNEDCKFETVINEPTNFDEVLHRCGTVKEFLTDCNNVLKYYFSKHTIFNVCDLSMSIQANVLINCSMMSFKQWLFKQEYFDVRTLKQLVNLCELTNLQSKDPQKNLLCNLLAAYYIDEYEDLYKTPKYVSDVCIRLTNFAPSNHYHYTKDEETLRKISQSQEDSFMIVSQAIYVHPIYKTVEKASRFLYTGTFDELYQEKFFDKASYTSIEFLPLESKEDVMDLIDFLRTEKQLLSDNRGESSEQFEQPSLLTFKDLQDYYNQQNIIYSLKKSDVATFSEMYREKQLKYSIRDNLTIAQRLIIIIEWLSKNKNVVFRLNNDIQKFMIFQLDAIPVSLIHEMIAKTEIELNSMVYRTTSESVQSIIDLYLRTTSNEDGWVWKMKDIDNQEIVRRIPNSNLAYTQILQIPYWVTFDSFVKGIKSGRVTEIYNIHEGAVNCLKAIQEEYPEYLQSVKSISFSDSVTRLDTDVLECFPYLESLEIPGSVSEVTGDLKVPKSCKVLNYSSRISELFQDIPVSIKTADKSNQMNLF